MVVLGIGLLLLAVVIPYTLSLRESANRVACASNLTQIYNGLKAYRESNQAYPMTPQDPDHLAGYTAFTGVDAADPFAAGSAVRPNDVTASLWLLVRRGYVKAPAVFVCPSTSDYADNLADAAGKPVEVSRRGNFRSARNLSYGVTSPFSAVEYYRWDDTLPPDCALLADKGPGAAAARVPASASPLDLAAANSANHRGAGQNVLYADSSVRFESHPYCGIGYKPWAPDGSEESRGDNIYTALRATPILPPETPKAYLPGVTGRDVGPAWVHDSYLVPAAGE